MTVGQAAEKVLGTATYDTALPQRWLDHVVAELRGKYAYHQVSCQFVWAYDDDRARHGRPCALTEEANEILTAINELMGSTWPLTPNPAC
jgi:hypothetical protein